MITSTANQTIKAVRKLRERKERQQTQLFAAEGLRIIGELMQQPSAPEFLIYSPELNDSAFGLQLVEVAAAKKVEIIEVSKSVFESLAHKDNPQGLIAVGRQRWTELDEVQLPLEAIAMALDAVADPGNLGTVMRTLDAVGGRVLFLADQCTDPYDPTAVRASMGSLFNLQLVRCSSVELVNWKLKAGVSFVGTSDSSANEIQTFTFPSEAVLLMGSERKGLNELLLQNCDEVVRIPMEGSLDSLNLAVAAGITLYQAYFQHLQTREQS